MRIPALYMRGGTSKGAFFNAADLPVDKDARDALLLRVIGSPDSYQKQIDGLGGASSSTSKVDILARILSMGKMHHAFTGTGSIALAVAAALPGSIVARNLCKMSSERQPKVVRIGHASGRLAIGATVRQGEGGWQMDQAILSRSARVLMLGWVHV